MAQTLLAYYCFNDNDATLVSDFSGNQRNSTAETGFSISTDSGAVGKVGVFNGTTTYLNFGAISAFNNITGFSIVTKFKTTAIGAQQIISNKATHHTLEITAAGKVKITVHDNGVTSYTCTHDDVLVAGQWYTVVCSWDGSNINIYVSSLSNVKTAAASFVNISGTADVLTIGATVTPGTFWGGSMEMISYYSKGLDDDEVNAVMESPTGIMYEALDGKLQTGDLVYNQSGGKEVVTWYEEFTEREFNDGTQRHWDGGDIAIFPN